MNTTTNITLRNILGSILIMVTLVSMLAFLLLTHPLVVNILADEIIPVHIPVF